MSGWKNCISYGDLWVDEWKEWNTKTVLEIWDYQAPDAFQQNDLPSIKVFTKFSTHSVGILADEIKQEFTAKHEF